MKKVVLTFGLLSGLVIAATVWVSASFIENGALSFERLEFVGYASMLIALSMVFFGIKSYRDNYNGGKITFWKGVQIGLLISVISGVFYFGGAWGYTIANPGWQASFMQKFTEVKVGKLREQGAPQTDIDKATAEIDMMKTLFANPFLFFLICMVEILPVGILVTLISSALLRRKELLPAAT